MTERRQAPAKKRAEGFTEKAIRAIVAGANRLLETLGPQSQLEPIPVRVRNGRGKASR